MPGPTRSEGVGDFIKELARTQGTDEATVEADFFKKNLGKAVIWDVGASVGKLTTIMAKSSPEATIHAFEPNLNSLYFLAYRTASYKNVIIVPCALTTLKVELGGSGLTQRRKEKMGD